MIYLPHAANLADQLAGAEAHPANGDARAVRVVARSFNHLTATDVDSNVVDAGSGGAKEDEITSSLVAEGLLVAAVAVLGLSVVDDGVASALVDRVLGETAAVKSDHVAIITIGRDVLLDTIGGTIVVSATPAVGVLADHALGGRGDLVTTVGLGAHSKSDDSKNNKETHRETHTLKNDQSNLKRFKKRSVFFRVSSACLPFSFLFSLVPLI